MKFVNSCGSSVEIQNTLNYWNYWNYVIFRSEKLALRLHVANKEDREKILNENKDLYDNLIFIKNNNINPQCLKAELLF